MKHYINRLYGSQKECAKALGVSSRAIRYWLTERPLCMLKHSDKIIKQTNTTQLELVGEVLHQDELLREQKYEV